MSRKGLFDETINILDILVDEILKIKKVQGWEIYKFDKMKELKKRIKKLKGVK